MLDHAPLTEADVMERLGDWRWRITSGHLYKIMAKVETKAGDEDDNTESASIEVPFIPNAAQMSLINDLHNKSVILKARQLGFSTLIEIMALDHALFNKDQSVVITAHTVIDAKKLMRTKIRYAYDRLPGFLREVMPLETDSKEQLIFGHNGSAIEVTTSARGGTVNFLHVSEMGKIAAKFPDKAREITTGSLQAVPETGFCFIESTAEGQDGAFFEIARRAESHQLQLKRLTPADYNFHFFSWWMNPEYTMDPTGVSISSKQHTYFDGVEDETGCTLTLGQRAWYVKKVEGDFAHEPNLMWREFPSTSSECWKSGIEGKYFAKLIQKARADGRIADIPIHHAIPANTFWDLGVGDDNVCWVHQHVAGWDNFIDYKEEAGGGLLLFLTWLDSLGLSFDTHYLPHDASHRINGIEQPTSIVSQLRAARPSWNWVVVPRVSTKQHAIDLMRLAMATNRYHETNCKEGINHIENYSREFNTRLQTWTDTPRHDEHSHASDAAMQHAQGFKVSGPPPKDKRTPAQKSGLAA